MGKKQKADPSVYERSLETSHRRHMDSGKKARDIAPGPEIQDRARRDAAAGSLKTFLETYFPGTFRLAWSADHLRVIARLEQTVVSGGGFALAMPRGSGKTSLCERAALWAVLTGRRRYVVIVAANEGLAEKSLKHLKSELEFNALLLADWPKACYPIHRLQNQARRCDGQLWEGERTAIGWERKRVVFPTVPGPDNEASGAVIEVGGLAAAVRGLSHVNPAGETIRPDLVLVDDPQDRESARSITQTTERLAILNGDLLGLAGPGNKIAALCTCTVINRGDVADRLLDPERSPAWQGERCKMVYDWPERTDLWDEYKALRLEGLKQGGDRGAGATAHYAANREEMDRGSRVAWPERFEPGELSALQHAFNIRIDRPEAFASEYQNEPLAPAQAIDLLDPADIAGRCSGFERGTAPPEVEKITAFIDVGATLLWWSVCGWSEDFSGYVLDYGTWPEQPDRVFLARNASPDLDSFYPSAGNSEGAVFAGLADLISKLCGREWRRSDGAGLRLSRLLIDSGWQTKVVRLVIRQHECRDVLIPSKGVGIGPAQTAINDYHKKPGEKIGEAWILGIAGPDRLRLLRYDTNAWKTRVAGMLTRPRGTKGGIELFGDRPVDHELIGQHLASEYPTRTEARGTAVNVWSRRPDRENHWLDCLVGCAVGANLEGLSPLAALGIKREEPRKRVSFSELQRKAQEARAAAQPSASGRHRVSFSELQRLQREKNR